MFTHLEELADANVRQPVSLLFCLVISAVWWKMGDAIDLPLTWLIPSILVLLCVAEMVRATEYGGRDMFWRVTAIGFEALQYGLLLYLT